MKILTAIMLLAVSAASQAALIGRAPATSGGTDYQAYWDDALNITWLADANYAATTNYDADGRMTWDDAMTWVGTLNTSSHLSITGWRLPTMIDVGNDGCADPLNTSGGDCGYNIDTANGEMVDLFYNTLGNVAFYYPDGTFPQPNFGLSNAGPFTNLIEFLYWTDSEVVTDTSAAWYFGFPSGAQRPNGKTELYHAWAVVDGDPLAAPVPVPAAVWLFGSALGLLGWARRRTG